MAKGKHSAAGRKGCVQAYKDMVLFLAFAEMISLCNSFVPPWETKPTFTINHNQIGRHSLFQSALKMSDVVDVEFEDVEETPTQPKRKRDVSSTSTSGLPTKSLIDLSLESDPEMKNTPVPFEDGHNYINCNLAFTVDLDGVDYGIGVPHEHSVAIAIKERDGSVVCLSPDDEESVELMEIMASELKKNLGQDLDLKRTPRVLTVSGDLGRYTDGWQNKFFDAPMDFETLVDDADESNDFLHDFFRRELGEEEYRKTMEEDMEIDDELMKLFEVPGLGTREDDEEGVEEILSNMFTEDPSKEFDSIRKDLDQSTAGLRLIAFDFRDGKSYSLIKMLKPFTLVARQVVGKDGKIRFELLPREEEKVIIPRLEELCQKELEEANLTLKGP